MELVKLILIYISTNICNKNFCPKIHIRMVPTSVNKHVHTTTSKIESKSALAIQLCIYFMFKTATDKRLIVKISF